MLPIHKLIWHEWRARGVPERVPEPSEAMEDPEQIRAYVKAYEWGGPTSALQMYHLTQLASMIRPGDTVVDLACGPGPLLLELAPLYPECRFIGADLSQPMLDVLAESAAAKGLRNVETLCEDIRDLPSLTPGTVDMVITTSALHHLPDLECLERVFERAERLLKPDGGLYVFDFGLVRSAEARALLVADVARKAPRVTAVDYKHSLDAAFPVDEVVTRVRRAVPRPLTIHSSQFIDFFYFIRTSDRCQPAANVMSFVSSMRQRCGMPIRLEAAMLKHMQRAR
ncbi:class I SAM-dependent methyltransferase [Rubrivivax albus]|uniref:Class I SAM-dependent methyltransferase n=1 Tax=Rubrivivax albus TaxID=2499835 RepID=A0A437JZH7_9BURK|nr:class I SAM-dependent methyltransferase [Rubrivivax albus]RVT53434.1 class I SAM-dependent methyltransferase [Rubrivivax albus]